MKHYYFDWAATAPIESNVVKRYADVSANYPGNPSSGHRPGREASGLLYDLRSSCAGYLGCNDSQLIFTSGGSESNGLVLSSFLWKRGRGSVLIPWTEHPSVYEYEGFLKELGFSVIRLDAHAGFIDPYQLKKKLQPDTVLVCLNAVHNITGAVTPLEETLRIIRSHEQDRGKHVHIHLDAVQALGKIPFSLQSLDVDSASFSAHKISGPRGVGCLYTRNSLQPLSRGGDQEFGQRPGTEHIAGIAGFHEALAQAVQGVEDSYHHALTLRRAFFDTLQDQSIISWMGEPDRFDQYSPFIILCTVSPIPSEVFIRVLSDRGFYLSAGSACSSQSSEKRERALTSLGFSSNISSGAVRISFGPKTREQDVCLLAETMEAEAKKLRDVLQE